MLVKLMLRRETERKDGDEGKLVCSIKKNMFSTSKFRSFTFLQQENEDDAGKKYNLLFVSIQMPQHDPGAGAACAFNG